MQCPVCKDSMIILELNQVEVDFCPSCKGVWLDSGELELLFRNEVDNTVDNLLHLKIDLQETKRRCPICKKKMDKVEFENSGIVIDKCKNNHGLWFDKGELHSLLSMDARVKDNKIINLLKEMFGE
jgi:Zn-finger nucleic acid-binding protein